MQANPTSGPPDFAAKTAGFFGRLGKSLDTFWQRVTEGLEIQALWSQFVADARESYSLYTREVDWEALQRESRWKRFTKTTSALFWAMILKLSPARRVFLLIALVFGILALAQTRAARTEQGVVVAMPQNFTFVLLSVGGLLFLLALELADRVTMKRDLEIAREIQRWLVPDTPPRVPGVDIAFASRPANTVGGDYYDAFLSDAPQASGAPGHLLLAVADVAGKSVPAALLMATFQASLRSLASRRSSLTELVVGINRYACAHSLAADASPRRSSPSWHFQTEPSPTSARGTTRRCFAAPRERSSGWTPATCRWASIQKCATNPLASPSKLEICCLSSPTA